MVIVSIPLKTSSSALSSKRLFLPGVHLMGGEVIRIGNQLVHVLLLRGTGRCKTDSATTVQQEYITDQNIVHAQGVAHVVRVLKIQKGAGMEFQWYIFLGGSYNDWFQKISIEPTMRHVELYYIHSILTGKCLAKRIHPR